MKRQIQMEAWILLGLNLGLVTTPLPLSGAESPPEQRPIADGSGVPLPKTAPASSAFRSRLESIRFESVSFPGLPLGAVVQYLVEESSKRDAAKRGVNMVFSPTDPVGLPPASLCTIDPQTGLPTGGTPETADLRAISVRIDPPLKDVRFIDVLDAIARVSDYPVKFLIEDYAVIITPDWTRARLIAAASTPPLQPTPQPALEPGQRAARLFQLNTNVLAPSIEKMFGRKIRVTTSDLASDLREFILPSAGIQTGERMPALLYNELTQVLLVRGLPEDLSLAQSLVELLGGRALKSEPANHGPH